MVPPPAENFEHTRERTTGHALWAEGCGRGHQRWEEEGGEPDYLAAALNPAAALTPNPDAPRERERCFGPTVLPALTAARDVRAAAHARQRPRQQPLG
jgi:hypothetical protein